MNEQKQSEEKSLANTTKNYTIELNCMTDAFLNKKRKRELTDEIRAKLQREGTSLPFDVLISIESLLKHKKVASAVCDQCGNPIFTEARYMRTHKWGYERPFCSDCIKTCRGCDEEYVESMAYCHESCDRGSSDDETKESENSSSTESDKCKCRNCENPQTTK